MNWPQILILVFMSMDLGLTLALHGKPKDSKYSFWITLISNAITMFILYKGDFSHEKRRFNRRI